MEIDIISYTDKQYAALTEEQLLEVKSAQLQKNRLQAALAEDIEKEKHRLVENGIFMSGIWELIKAKLQAEFEQEVENLRESLLFYLRFSTAGGVDVSEAPYTVDYSLSDEERFYVVRDYYLDAYANGAERMAVFKADKVAPQYLGELYAPLYDYFLSMVE